MVAKFEDVLRTVREGEGPLNPALLRRFSNLQEPERESLVTAWGGIPLARRLAVLQGITGMLEDEFDTDFSAVTRLALTDLDASLREAAIEASWPDETPELLNRLLPMASIDLSDEVRAAALSALGRFILQAELGKFDAQLARQAENIAIRLYRDPTEAVSVRRRALEAVSNSSRPEVEPMIREAYGSGDAQLRASAVFAMGRSCDSRWSPIVLRELNSDDPAIRYEAARAAGELELEESVPQLAKLLVDQDRQLLEAAVWSLGEIGGSEALRLITRVIEYAQDIDDPKLLEQAEDALATASLAGSDLEFD